MRKAINILKAERDALIIKQDALTDSDYDLGTKMIIGVIVKNINESIALIESAEDLLRLNMKG